MGEGLHVQLQKLKIPYPFFVYNWICGGYANGEDEKMNANLIIRKVNPTSTGRYGNQP